MSIKAILFDLDGTLLPMDLKTFQMTSGQLFIEKMMPFGYDPEKLGKAQWDAIMAMSANDGSKVNSQRYFEKMVEIYGEDIKKDFHLFGEYYENEFDNVKKVCGFNPESGPAVEKLKDMDYQLVLASNAWFPESGFRFRLQWAGVDPGLFEFMTDFDQWHYCKPKLGYYEEILERLGLSAEECLMVGNDVQEDMIAAQLGIRVFLMTDDLINRDGTDVSGLPQGSFAELFAYLKEMEE